MRYLALPELEQLNSLLTAIDSDDGKAAGADKKLWKHVENRELSSSDDLLGSSPPGPTDTGIGRKLLYYLIATMNLVFPDYDFSDLPPEVFHQRPYLAHVMSHVSTTLFNTGANKSFTNFGEFSTRMWERIDTAIGLEDCEIYSFEGTDFDTLEDPFWERGCM